MTKTKGENFVILTNGDKIELSILKGNRVTSIEIPKDKVRGLIKALKNL
jgi:hypothetical protein